MQQNLSGRVAWVTGAGTGIGASAALKLAETGCRVVLSGRRREPLEGVAEQVAAAGGEAVIEPLDVADQPAVAEVAARVIEHFGRIDICVFSAGVNVPERSWSVVTTEAWDRVIRANLDGAFYCCHAVVPTMRAQGEGLIINVSSLAAKGVSTLTGPAYIASKHALNAFTASLLLEERNHGIRATTVCPGEVNTPILEHRPEPVSAADRARVLQPEDVGDLIRYIAQAPPHVTINDVTITPTWNRFQVPAL